MKFKISRDEILKPLQQVVGIVERRQTLAVLSNILFVVDNNILSLTGTDLEIELISKTPLSGDVENGETTIPAKKLFDICKSLPSDAVLEFSTEDERVAVKSGRSRFSLVTMPSGDFPNLDEHVGSSVKFSIATKELKHLIENTGFAMAQQDVRYYLNGMLFEVSSGQLKAVATDGHRLALTNAEITNNTSEASSSDDKSQAIIPRKGVLELSRLFGDADGEVELVITNNHIQAKTDSLSFTSKLVDGKFPDYDRVIPKAGDKLIVMDREEVRLALSRVAILSNDKFRGVRLILESGGLQLLANNPEQEEAEENIAVDYTGESLEIGFNVNYLLDVMNTLNTDTVELILADANSSGILKGSAVEESLYVVMPMRL